VKEIKAIIQPFMLGKVCEALNVGDGSLPFNGARVQ
jgi:nitrogen regulatory protein PII